jgi:hypothetical protein
MSRTACLRSIITGLGAIIALVTFLGDAQARPELASVERRLIIQRVRQRLHWHGGFVTPFLVEHPTTPGLKYFSAFFHDHGGVLRGIASGEYDNRARIEPFSKPWDPITRVNLYGKAEFPTWQWSSLLFTAGHTEGATSGGKLIPRGEPFRGEDPSGGYEFTPFEPGNPLNR